MIKPPIPNNEEERLSALRAYHIMDTLSETEYDDITKIASEICQAPVALITFMDRNRQWFKSSVGVELTENARDLTFCGHGMENPDEPLVVSDATQDPRFSDNPLVTGEHHVRFYAGIQLVNKEGFPLGSLCVLDVKSKELTERQLNTLKILANQVMRLLDLRKTVHELENSKSQLVRANQHLEEFDYIISHDIKAPLRNLKHLADALQEDYGDQLDARGKEYLDLMEETAIDAISYVDGILDYSKSIHYIQDQYEDTDLNKLVASIIKLTKVPEHIQISLAESLPVLYCSKIAFRQIFSNIISNAVKYHDKEEGWIKINYIDEEEQHIFEVADNGQGIPKEKLDQIFTLFYMVDKKNARQKGSSGIGLSIVKKLINEMGGEINVRSVLGEGSIFEFSIPKHSPD